MPEECAPPVVAVVVASDSGPWLETCLASISAQSYSNLTTIVIDAASERSLAPRVAAVAPSFYFARLDENRGFGPSANAVLNLTEGAAHFLFCHDDVILGPDVVRRMSEEAFRSNAGIVGPKLVDEDQPDRILQLGIDMDRFGAPVRRVERREFDQAQHDEAREVFAVPGGCMLVRSDLFEAIGGFDEEISMFGEDIDLAWRARIAGARVVVTPLATVRHLEATAARRRPLPQARALQWRHELRAVLKNYGAARRTRIVVQLAALSVLEVVYFTVVGRRRRAREVIDAWRWNLARPRRLDEARAAVAATRRLPDRVVLRLATRSSFRFLRAVQARTEDAIANWTHGRAPSAHAFSDEPGREQRPTWVTAAAFVAGFVVVFGSRLVIFGHLPVVGEYLPFPGPFHLLSDYLGGSSGAGNGPVGPVSPAYAILGIVGIVAFGAMGVVLKVAMIAAVASGAFGAARLVRPFCAPRARLAAGVTYLFLPLVWDDLARGDLQALVAYGAMPWILLRIAKATGSAPFADAPRRVRSTATLTEAIGLGLVVAVGASFAPVIVLAIGAASIGIALISFVFGERIAAARVLAVSAGSIGVAFVLCFPWSLTFLQPGARFSAFASVAAAGRGVPNFAALARFDLGPIGHGVLSYAAMAAAVFVLVVGEGVRFSWGARFWGAALSAAALAWVVAEGWVGHGGGATRVLVAPAAVAIAAAVGIGVGAVERDVLTARFSWRHAASVAFVLFGLAALLPVLAESPGGRWTTPQTGYDTVLSGVAGSHGGVATGRYLWLGAPLAVPANGYQVRRGFEAAVTSSALPDATAIQMSANPGTVSRLAAAVSDAELGRTIELGRLVAGDGVTAIVVPTSFAPVLTGVQASTLAPPPPGLLSALANQQDLRELPSEGGTYLFANTAWHPPKSGVLAVPSGSTPSFVRVLGVVVAIGAWIGLGVLAVARRRRRARMRRSRSAKASVAPGADAPARELVATGSPT